ncbi:AfsR/SARP family transcriptional regulator [Streptomyces radiopugnans]|uniref:DNA-binding transcriptional activator of the SARP family n=1 Tax=Streptomyces radiopugnans TaxID=403935 RepID=A0A1H9FJM6_9ACTN|nr:BTAD domain-containing putative transcriptional regulator [Streptomyces radiopugnans]SEQ38124.1 DNA-binding transcriptional activator of the SARP family [Streptomyces radiopugnans]
MELGILGPVEIRRHDGARLGPRAGRERSLLALLVLNTGYVLPHDRIVDLLWEDPPGSARAQVYNLVSGLRRRLRTDAGGAGREALVTTDGGYLLRSGTHTTDLAVFRDHASRGRGEAEAGRFGRAAELLSAALGCWRGTALSGCSEPFVPAARQGLEEERWRTVEALLDARLALGEYERVLAEVDPLLARQPHREDLYRRRMLALAGQGRRADALACYREAYRRLGDDLGVGPGAQLRELHRRILEGAAVGAPDGADGPGGAGAVRRERRGGPAEPADAPAEAAPVAAARTAPPAPSSPPAPPSPVPRQLPAVTGSLYGRGRLLNGVRAALRGGGITVPVVVLTGPGGAGKTAAALHAGHALADEFPGGQLHADLRGSQETPADPYDTAARLLRGLGADGQDIPADPEERTAELRSRLAGRRVLLLLDDVRDEAQLRPLLPGTADCAVLATSRRRLTALAGARTFTVSTLAPQDAVLLLTRLVGTGRTAAEPAATAEVARLCGHLPLALCIAGARLAARPDWTIGGFRDRLARHRRRLDQLAVGDLDVRAGIALGYRSLAPDLRTALRRLGLLDTRSVPAWVLGVLAGRPDGTADRLTDQLVERHLLEAVGTDRAGQPRFRLHVLVHDFAAERALAEDSPAEREAAVLRVLRAWAALASRAAERLGHGGALDPVEGAGEPPADAARAARRRPADWFSAEQANLISAVSLAARLRRPELAADLALQVGGHLLLRFYEKEREEVVRTAIGCWGEDAAGDRRLCRLYFALCWTLYQQDRYEELLRTAERALAAARDLGDPEIVADATWQVAKATALKGRLPEAAEHYGRSVRECERLDLSDRARVYSLTGLANTLADLGDAAGAVDHYRRALERHTAADRTRVVMLLRCAEAVADRGDGPEALGLLAEAGRITAGIGDEVGAAHVERVRALVAVLGHDWPRARSALVSALEVLRAHNEASGTAQALRSLGDTEIGAGRTEEACGALREALSLYRGMRAPVEIARTEARLSAALVLAGEPPSAGGHAAAFRSALDRYGLPPASLRLPPHVRRLLPAAD